MGALVCGRTSTIKQGTQKMSTGTAELSITSVLSVAESGRWVGADDMDREAASGAGEQRGSLEKECGEVAASENEGTWLARATPGAASVEDVGKPRGSCLGPIVTNWSSE